MNVTLTLTVQQPAPSVMTVNVNVLLAGRYMTGNVFQVEQYLNNVMRKLIMWFSTRSGVYRPVQSHKHAGSLKFCIKGEEELYYLCCENKGTDQLCSFSNTICWFSDAAAELSLYGSKSSESTW